MNLLDIRNALFSQSDWAPTQSPDAITRVNEFINRAYYLLSQEAPFLFFEQMLKIATLVDKEPDTVSGAVDTLSVVALDPWVLQRNLPNTTATITLWPVDDSWNSRMLEVTGADGVVRRRRIRDIWTFADPLGVENQRISLYRPWPNVVDTAISYRIYNEAYYLPDDVVEVNSIRLHESGQNWPIEIVGQLEAEQLSLADLPDQVAAGVPRSAYRRGHFQLETPTKAPRLVINDPPWAGPDHAGQFEYIFTYTWGYRDSEIQDHGPDQSLAVQPNTAHREPRFESAPSPSSSVTLTNNSASVFINTPSIDYMQGFGTVADSRYQHGGWRKRIYRRRKTVVAAAPPNAALTVGEEERELPNEYYLLFDIPGHQTSVTDSGLVIPDYHRRIRDVHGYQALQFYPRANNRYEVEVRCLRRPQKLADDQDVPRVHLDAVDCLIQKALGFLYEAQGNIELADRALARYTEALFTMTKRYGDLRYPAQPLLKRPARAHRVVNTGRPWRRWYNLP